MQIKASVITAAFIGLIGISAANATCAVRPTGAWNLFLMQTYPGATSKADAITCHLTFGNAGAFTGPCISYQTGKSATDNVSVNGTLTMHTACDFTGSITIPGDTPVTIQAGHINGNIGSGVATQKSAAQERVLLFNLLKR
jgi:hypothetical protein